MVLGSTSNGKPIHFEIKLDGEAPGNNSGVDLAPDGTGEIREPRLYQTHSTKRKCNGAHI